MNDRLITIEKNKVIIPEELYEAMNNPNKIRVIPMSYPDVAFFKKPELKDNIFTIYRLLKKITGKKTASTPKIISYSQKKGDRVEYSNNKKFDFKHSKFHILNYHWGYFLLPSSDLPESKSREKSWEEIKNYHEHLKVDLQDKDANKLSEWLATDIFKKLKGKTVLELGCGAGRNLIYLHKNNQAIQTIGIDINNTAINVAKEQLKQYNSKLICKSIYDLKSFPDKSIDVVFTSGVLMHIPQKQVKDLIREMHRIAKLAVVHFELDGPSHNFDYHRYPRNYKKLYQELNIKGDIKYEKFPENDFRSRMTKPFSHALLICKIK